MKLRMLFQGGLCTGALLAIVGGGAIGICTFIDPNMEILARLDQGYRHIVFGFLFLTVFALASSILEALGRVPKPVPAPEPLPAAVLPHAEPAPAVAPSAQKTDPAKLDALYHEMKTYIDLEMWELAMEKANRVVKEYPGTKEAERVASNLNELRWKAEPKYMAQQAPITADQEKQLREKGLAAMYNHVKTYMDLDMWELARQKAVAILKSFPDSPEAGELMKMYETIEKKARAAVSAPPVPEQAERI
ncbi:MAG TPA: tetratricopeptide repeat protein [Planctomycetota bacterium]|nr:tetratricopeptide repeat protein [Planctomycetota bacterium]